jgi:hypothetical protein
MKGKNIYQILVCVSRTFKAMTQIVIFTILALSLLASLSSRTAFAAEDRTNLFL